MDISIIHDQEQFHMLSVEWNHLLAQSVVDVPFLRHEYLLTWWETLGGGEWDSGDLWIVAGKAADGNLVGLAPLFRTIDDEGSLSLMFLGSIEISDYLDLIVKDEELEGFVRESLDVLAAQPLSDWERIDLYNLPEWSPTGEVLISEAQRRGWDMSRERLQPCPFIDLNMDWESYLGSLSKKQRHELRRKIRRAESQPEGVSLRTVNTDEDIDRWTEAFIDLMAFDPKKKDFLTEEMCTQIRHSALEASRSEWLLFTFLEVGDQIAAGYMNFDYGDRIWVYNSGLNPEYLSLSPGWVLTGYLIQWGIERGRQTLDFMRGDEQYKYRLGGVDRYIQRLAFSR
ncbi:MAG: GNAT family N-acetyltransferase [Anaerolineales bacterium]|nr:GNAT family N-acetyltransferase [Anaerolineales bacterium]